MMRTIPRVVLAALGALSAILLVVANIPWEQDLRLNGAQNITNVSLKNECVWSWTTHRECLLTIITGSDRKHEVRFKRSTFYRPVLLYVDSQADKVFVLYDCDLADRVAVFDLNDTSSKPDMFLHWVVSSTTPYRHASPEEIISLISAYRFPISAETLGRTLRPSYFRCCMLSRSERELATRLQEVLRRRVHGEFSLKTLD